MKNVKKNVIWFTLFWYKVFVHWKLKLLAFLMGSVLNKPKQAACSSWPIYCLTVKQWKKTGKPTFKLRKNTTQIQSSNLWHKLKFKCIICRALPTSSVRRKVVPKQYEICPYSAFKIPMKSHPEKQNTQSKQTEQHGIIRGTQPWGR